MNANVPRLVTCLFLTLAAPLLSAQTEAPVVSPVEEAVTGMRLFKKPESGSELQTAELHYRREADGAKVTLEEWHHLPHVFHLFADFIPEGGQAIRRINGFVRQHA